MNIDELKEYMSAHFDNLRGDITRLSTQVGSVDSSMRTIELNTTRSITEMKKDIEEIYSRLDSIERFSNVEKLEAAMQASDMAIANRVKNIEDSHKFKWDDLYKQRQAEAIAFQKYQSDIAATIKTLADSYSLITKLLWTIVVILLGYGIPKFLDWIAKVTAR